MKTRENPKAFASDIFTVADALTNANACVVDGVCVCVADDVCVLVVLVVDSFTVLVVRALALSSTSAMILLLGTCLSTSPSLYSTAYV